MIQKKYEYFSKEGKKWTQWFNYREKDEDFFDLLNDEKWQLKNKLRNDFRIV